jgi:lipopolysaccharide biosynthesis protein
MTEYFDSVEFPDDRNACPKSVTVAPWRHRAMTANTKARVLAFYLPQFHPIPENDAWWGRGFTEWTNVTRARPLFRGHYQPHIPGDLSFYDLRLPDTRAAQAQLARRYGIEGFCYYHYWFNGKRLLERPFDDVLRSGEPDFPFCLAWANESWSRRWLGEERDLLMAQTYSPADDLNHARWLVGAFEDPRYIRIDGRPLFLIYRPVHLPDPRRTTDTIRDECAKHGLSDPYLLGMDSHCRGTDCTKIGFDGTLDFEPYLGVFQDFMNDTLKFSKLKRNIKLGIPSPKLKIYDYADARARMRKITRPFAVTPSIFVSWDNSPRRGDNGIIIVNSTPELFESGLRECIKAVQQKPYESRLVFVNAWNEWAEGNHLEPDLRFGHGYLDAVARANRIEAGG